MKDRGRSPSGSSEGPPLNGERPRRLQSVDALRAVAACWVVLSHSALGTGQPSRWVSWLVPLGQLGYAGVGLFLVLSGFSIHLSWAQGRAGPFSARAFWRRRFLRLYPTYLISLALVTVVLVVLFGADAASEEANAFRDISIWHGPTWLTIVNSVTLVFANFWVIGLIPQAWSLALEEQIYLVYSWRGRAWSARPFRMLAISAVVAITFRTAASVILEPHSARYAMYFHLPSRAFEWVLGLVVAEAHAERIRLPRVASSLPLGLALVITTGYLALHPTGWIDWHHRFSSSLILAEPMFGIGFAIILGWCLQNEERLLRSWAGAGWRAAATIGLFSYSMYLLHPAILRAMNHLSPGSGPLHRLQAWTVVLFVSWAFYMLVERRFIMSASRRSRSGHPQ